MLCNLKITYIQLGFYIFLIILFSASTLLAADLKIAWDPPDVNTDGTPLTDLQGYIVSYGTEPENYSQNIDVGNATTYTVTNLTPGNTYYFVVTAYNSFENKSHYSNAISATIQPENVRIDYYCDNDNDSYIDSSTDGSCLGTGCEPVGCQITPGNDCNDNNTNIYPGTSDANCDGIDKDCDGIPDDEYVSQITQCGKGECESVGLLICQGGEEVDTCTLGIPTEEPEVTCNDGLDNDCDGTTDNADLDCYKPDFDADGDGYTSDVDCNDNEYTIHSAAVEDCTDGVDNDCDGLVDTADSSAVNCAPDCTDADGDGYAIEGEICGPVDCDDANVAVNPGVAEVCNDIIDNDCDGTSDCGNDPDCDTDLVCGSPCEPVKEICDDGVDNDCDTLVDCDDLNCRRDIFCNVVEICDDGIDNDGDGKTDCSDNKDCRKDPSCSSPTEICNDGIDNDGDGKTDCADNKDCRKDPSCA
jgi:hypothetical protein